MVDPTRGGNATYNGPLSSSQHPAVHRRRQRLGQRHAPATRQSAGVDAHYGIAKTWDFYKTTFGRNGIANDGKGARSFVHDGAYVNASWSDSCFCMRYGDGDADDLPAGGARRGRPRDEPRCHQPHRRPDLPRRERRAQRGHSDIMGTNVEWYANNANDVPDYVIGEEIYRSYNPATNYIRRMDKPSIDGASQDCWSTATKRVDVHYSSGPANHFFYLLSEGSGAKTLNGIAYNSPTCNGSTVTGIGRTAAAAIWYRALTVYMTSSTNYAGARVADGQRRHRPVRRLLGPGRRRQGRLVGGVGELIHPPLRAQLGRAASTTTAAGPRGPAAVVVPGRAPARRTAVRREVTCG